MFHIKVLYLQRNWGKNALFHDYLLSYSAEPKTEGIDEDAVTEVRALPVLIQSNGGTITVQGASEGTEIYVYSVNGMKEGSAIATKGFATINTSLQPGSTAIVRIGEKAVKVLVK